jgi:hypothetical protein
MSEDNAQRNSATRAADDEPPSEKLLPFDVSHVDTAAVDSLSAEALKAALRSVMRPAPGDIRAQHTNNSPGTPSFGQHNNSGGGSHSNNSPGTPSFGQHNNR